MRVLYSLFLCFFIQFNWSQVSVDPNKISYKEALVQSKKEKKPIFIMLYANWCPHCNTMKSTVFSDQKVKDFMNANYISVWKDIEKEDGKEIKELYKTNGLPTFLFIDANETLLYSVKGEMKKEAFINEATNALNPKLQLPYLEQQFLNNPSNVNACLAYIQTLRKGADRTALSAPTHLYLQTQTEQQLLSEINWRVIANGVTDIESRAFQFVLKNKEAFEKATSPKRVDAKITNIVSELLEPYTLNLDTTSYFQKRKIAKTIQLQKIDSLIFSYDLLLAERTKNWEFYKKVTIENTEKYFWNSEHKLKEIGQVYWKEITDVIALKKAIEWEKRAIKLNNSAEANLLLARLYAKIKDKKAALMYAKAANAITKEMGWDSTETDTILKELNTK